MPNKEQYARNINYYKRYQKENKERLAAYDRIRDRTIKRRYRSLKVRAKEKGGHLDITIEQHAALLANGVCHYCDGPLNCTGSGLDRKNSDLYYTLDNVVPCCSDCNLTFGDRYNYDEKLILAKDIKVIRQRRAEQTLQPYRFTVVLSNAVIIKPPYNMCGIENYDE
jgi:5-methylcytosine-specific restriction endonuclease McrA